MLDLDLDLEADLGVDTVKQAEMFAAIREIYNIPRDESRKLRDYPTLAHVIRFVFENRPDLDAALTVAPAVEVGARPAGAAAPAPVATGTQVASDESIKEKVLQIVAEKTGYPPEMLDLDLDLEADLGIDTVKQAEMFAAVRAAYGIPRDEALKLRDFPTLGHVIVFAQNGLARVAQAAAISAPASVPANPVVAPPPARTPRPEAASFDAANRIPRRVPVPNLRPPLSICKPTEVKLGAGSRVLVVSDAGGVAELLTRQLVKKGVEVLRITTVPDSEALVLQLDTWLSAGSVQGISLIHISEPTRRTPI